MNEWCKCFFFFLSFFITHSQSEDKMRFISKTAYAQLLIENCFSVLILSFYLEQTFDDLSIHIYHKSHCWLMLLSGVMLLWCRRRIRSFALLIFSITSHNVMSTIRPQFWCQSIINGIAQNVLIEWKFQAIDLHLKMFLWSRMEWRMAALFQLFGLEDCFLAHSNHLIDWPFQRPPKNAIQNAVLLAINQLLRWMFQ